MGKQVNLTSKIWTVKYALICAMYYAAFCSLHAYASVFLLDKNFTNSQIGILLAVANILSVAIQPYIAGLIDGPNRITNRIVLIISSLLLIVGSVLLFFIKNNFVAVFVIFILIYLVQMAFQPIVIAIYFEYEALGCYINFGLARGIGSCGFGLLSLFLGSAVENYGTNMILCATIGSMLLFAIISASFVIPKDAGKLNIPSSKEEETIEEGEAHNNIVEYIKTYPMFMLFTVGTMCFFFAHNMINDFMIQIVRNLGGAESQLGYATSLQAFLELPIMAASVFLIKKFKVERLIVFSGTFFLIKTLILLFATNMVGMYISQLCQLFAYGLFIPVTAYYVNQEMQANDQVKGQAYLNCAFAIGGVFSNAISGKLLDLFGIGTMLTVGSIVCAVGVVIAYVAVIGKRKAI